MQAEVFLYDKNTEANDFYNKKLRGALPHSEHE
jgi:hypothetical protein